MLPLSKKLNEGAEKVYAELCKYYNCEFDDRGNIGKRYRRQDEIGTPFCTSSVPSEVVMELASQKAADVAAGRKARETVIGSDTVVAIDGKILGKPKTHEEAREMIGMLSGRVHQVYTGVCVILKGEDGNDRSGSFSTRPMWRCIL